MVTLNITPRRALHADLRQNVVVVEEAYDLPGQRPGAGHGESIGGLLITYRHLNDVGGTTGVTGEVILPWIVANATAARAANPDRGVRIVRPRMVIPGRAR